MKWLRFLLYPLLFWQCQSDPIPPTLQQLLIGVESISGKTEFLNTPYVTAGDRLYMVGTQDGQFPDLGWHVTGEMGGIWDHPIKLLDGFTEQIHYDEQSICLPKAETFINYPFANQHIFPTTAFGLKVSRTQFVPDGKEAVFVEYSFQNETAQNLTFQFDFNAYIDLQPVWLGERTGMIDAGDFAVFQKENGTILAKDSLNDWFVIYGSDTRPDSYALELETCQYNPIGKGSSGSLQYELSLAANEIKTLRFTIAGSAASSEAAINTYEGVSTNWDKLLLQKKERYEQVANLSKLTIPDKEMETAFRWLKYNTDWLIRDVPAIGRGFGAGIPDYPWWFGVDSEYALQGMIACGQQALAKSTIELLADLSMKQNGNGRIVHEVSTNGAVFNPGNINETPQFASLIWTIYQWTGDLDFLKIYFPLIQNGLDWLLTENDADGNLLPDGFGMMEIHGLDSEMIDVAVYTQKAFSDAAQMADLLDNKELAAIYSNNADQIRRLINTDFWVPGQNSYADFIGTTAQALHLIEDAIVRADTLNKPWAVAELKALRAEVQTYPEDQKAGYVVFHNWVVNTPMEMGIADPEKALLALETGRKFTNPFGMFVTGIDRDETAGQDAGSFASRKKIFSYTGAVMTLPTGVQARAENNYGNPDEALQYLQRMTRTFSYALPGSMYEVSPDFGMVCQAWNIYSFAVPIVQQFFGVQPRAFDRKIRIQPLMPTSWQEASLENVLVADNSVNIYYQVESDLTTIRIDQLRPEWTIECVFPEGKYSTWTVNGKTILPKLQDGHEFVAGTGTEILLQLKH
ncbi:MAG: hypothetical protein KDC34_17455 [Saprospiraceae bacterium]|nr:hypothetical protein [Saprospiraceae bacterium]